MLVSLESLGHHTVQMLHDVLDAFARMDLNEAVRIYREDHKVDKEYEGIVRQLMTYMMEDTRTIPSVLTALFCARSIERIGDRCQNICKFIFYFVKGQDFRHLGGDALGSLLTGKPAEPPVTEYIARQRLQRQCSRCHRSPRRHRFTKAPSISPLLPMPLAGIMCRDYNKGAGACVKIQPRSRHNAGNCTITSKRVTSG